MSPPRKRRTPAPPKRQTRDERPSTGKRLLQLLIIFIGCVLVVNALAGEKGFFDTLRARRQYLDLGATVERLERENAALRVKARQLREDPRTIEEIARRDLGLIRPGELLFIVKDAESPAPLPK